MHGIELTRLDTSSFERLVRALCFHRFGGAGVVFPSGPDGGRDFIIEGPVKTYDSKKWSGYLVVQAKFRERLRGDASDVNWLLKQLAREQSKFRNRKRNLRAPEYYILATNISLSGSDGIERKGAITTGGYSKVEKALKEWGTRLKLKGFDIWTADKIADLLSDAPEIRQTFAAWVTPGDVLDAMLSSAKWKRPDFKDTIRRSLKNSLRRDQHARIKDGGSVSDQQIRTSQVFVDLPIDEESTFSGIQSGFVWSGGRPHAYMRDAEDLDVADLREIDLDDVEVEEADDTGLVDFLTSEAKSCFRANGSTGQLSFIDLPPGNIKNKFVLLGGPGQGKSTASLYLTQIFRASILATDPTTKLDTTVNYLVEEVLQKAEKEGISTNIPRRFPVHIILPRYADTITEAREKGEEIPTLLSYVAKELSRTSDDTVERGDVRDWLRLYPWLLVLDGLDEVPPSGERKAVIDAINTFCSEAVDANADILIIVTTRPQGYNSDLEPRVWHHLHLADLPIERALAYAKGLAEAQYPLDPERRAALLESLATSASKPATSRLMVSPLQVTIMYTIVDTGGSVPAARWTLFNDYFEILKRREKAKGGHTQKIIERNLPYLGPIHQRAGLILQVLSEIAGDASAYLDRDRFSFLLSEHLKAEGFAESALNERVSELTELALNRLVLLSAREEGRIEFDVRSLQEYMAAAAITAGNPIDIEERLRHIAGLAHWRHVFQIAASRCFAEDSFHYLRANIVSIARHLDSHSNDFFVRNGAKLALVMFQDGIGIDHPVYRRSLTAHALDFLEVGEESEDARMFTLFEPETSSILIDRIKSLINGGSKVGERAAWHLLLTLANRGVPEAEILVNELWPINTPLEKTLVRLLAMPLHSKTLIDRVVNALPRLSVSEASQYFYARRSARLHAKTNDEPQIDRLNFVNPIDFDNININIRVSGDVCPVVVRIDPLLESKRLSESLKRDTLPWTELSIAAKFAANPNKSSLASALNEIKEKRLFSSIENLGSVIPWPIQAIITGLESADGLEQCSNKAAAGFFGDIDDWMSAEKRWSSQGLGEADFEIARDGHWFDARVASVGSPGMRGQYSSYRGETNDIGNVIFRLGDIAKKLPNRFKDQLHRCMEICAYYLKSLPMDARDASRLLNLLLERPQSLLHPDLLMAINHNLYNRVDIAPLLSKISERIFIIPDVEYYSGRRHPDFLALAKAITERADQRGLIIFFVIGLLIERVSAEKKVKLLPPHAFEIFESDSPMVSAAVCALLLLSGRSIQIPEMTKRILHDNDNSNSLALLWIAVDREWGTLEQRLSLLIALMTEMGQWNTSDSVRIRRCLDRRQSALGNADTWKQLALPDDVFSTLKYQSENRNKQGRSATKK